MSRSLGQMIKEARVLQKMTIEEFAQKMRVGIHTIEKYESGEQIPSKETLLKLSTVLDIPADALNDCLKHHTASLPINV